MFQQKAMIFKKIVKQVEIFKIVYKCTFISKIHRIVLQLCTLMYPQKQIGMRYYMCQTDRQYIAH